MPEIKNLLATIEELKHRGQREDARYPFALIVVNLPTPLIAMVGIKNVKGTCRSLRRAITISPPFFPLNLDCRVLRNAVSKKLLPLHVARFRSRHLLFIASSCQSWARRCRFVGFR